MDYDPDIEKMLADGNVYLLAVTLQSCRDLVSTARSEGFRRGREVGYQEHQTHIRGQDMGG